MEETQIRYFFKSGTYHTAQMYYFFREPFNKKFMCEIMCTIINAFPPCVNDLMIHNTKGKVLIILSITNFRRSI